LESFEDLGIDPELVEALSAEGIERPTPLQEAAIPIIRRENSLVLVSGPGSGLLITWATGLLNRIDAEGDSPLVLVLTATTETADRLAESLARLTASTGHTTAALGSSWALPERAHILFATPYAAAMAASAGSISLTSLQALVVDQAQLIEGLDGLSAVEAVIDFVPADAQKILSALPFTPAVSDLSDRHFKRAMAVPEPRREDVPHRGSVRFRIVPEPREAGALVIVDELLADGARHVLLFTRSEDRAADLGDYLTLHGFVAGAPGDTSVPVWLGVEALEARPATAATEGLVVVSCDPPMDEDTLDRRHSLGDGGVVLVHPREVAHLRDLAKRTGYTVVPLPPRPDDSSDGVAELQAVLEDALKREDTGPYLLALAPLFERYDPAEVAAAAAALLRKKTPGAIAAARPATKALPAAGPAWAKLFVSVGSRDGLVPGDLLGAITGEAGVPGEAVGRIDIKESHALVEVHDAMAQQVIKAINGTTIRGRAVRADFDRPRRTTTRRASNRG
jgi:ATP-dependent RNA helicase DeaD